MATEIHETIYLYQKDEINESAVLSAKVSNDGTVYLQEEGDDEMTNFWIEIKKEDWEGIVNFVNSQLKKYNNV